MIRHRPPTRSPLARFLLARFLPVASLLLLVLAAVFAIGYRNARADPIVRRAAVALPGWSAGAPPITIALMSDIHMESAAMDGPRLARIVAQVNTLHPDLVVLAGDFVEGRGADEAERAIPLLRAALSRLRAPLGVVAVLGNHDHWTDPAPLARMLRRIGVVLLVNDAAGAGPLAIAGVDDNATFRDRIRPTLSALSRLQGAGVMVAHSPELEKRISPRIRLLLSGHTHCGQVVLPVIGPPVQVTRSRYRCRVVRDPGRVTIVTAGLGTSNLPIRFGAPPDLWLVRVGANLAAVSPPRP